MAVIKLSGYCGGDRASQVASGGPSGELFLRPAVELSEVCLRGDHPRLYMGAFERTNLSGRGGISRAHAKYSRSKSRTRDRQSPNKTNNSECGRDRQHGWIGLWYIGIASARPEACGGVLVGSLFDAPGRKSSVGRCRSTRGSLPRTDLANPNEIRVWEAEYEDGCSVKTL